MIDCGLRCPGGESLGGDPDHDVASALGAFALLLVLIGGGSFVLAAWGWWRVPDAVGWSLVGCGVAVIAYRLRRR